MKFFKKAREMFDRMTGSSVQVADAPPRSARSRRHPRPTPPPAEVIQDPRYAYRREQREFERRAAARTVIHDSSKGPMVLGRNAEKRSLRARLEPKFGRRWKKQHIPAVAA